MPLYEYFCENCYGIFEAIRPMREASLAVPCPECDRDGERIMSSFTAFTFRDGYPRRIPDKGTYWHMGKEVKQRAKRMKGWEHPELAKPKPKARPTKGESQAQRDKRLAGLREARYRDRWGIDKDGFPTMKTKVKEKEKKVLPAG
jgi:putative FmdB family regulatory protein